MKIIIIAVIILGGVYFWKNRADNSISAQECASAGGKITEHGCETPVTKADCETLGGIFRDGDCELRTTKTE